MPTVTLNDSKFPVGTTVGIYPTGSGQFGQPPTAAAIATGVVDAANLLTVTNAGILQGTTYPAYAQVNGEHRYVRTRSTLDVTDRGSAVGTLTTTNTSPNLTVVSPSSGALAVGQRIVGAGIPPGSYLISGSGASWVMSAPATASASGVAFTSDGATPAVAVLGATAVPKNITTWQAQVRQRRQIMGTAI